MRVDELDAPDVVVDALQAQGFRELHPPQADAIPIALEGSNLVAAIPTASGKSLIGYAAALKTIVSGGGKVLYIVPLKALASEKADDFAKFSDIGVRVHMSTGDLDSDDRGMKDANIVVSTSEKVDSLLRHGSAWMDDVKLVIADEVHMIHDPGRGPTLEVILTKMMRRSSDIQIIALSATISNSNDLADWLHARLVVSSWRPVPLMEGVFIDNRIRFGDSTEREVPAASDAISALVDQAIGDGGQCLVFVNSRRSTEAEAVRLSSITAKAGCSISDRDRAMLEGDTESTATGRKLAGCVAKGTAFHNAGLTYRQRRFVEDAFRVGDIKVIVATPTLAAGINLPARRVVVRDTTRFENGGNRPIAVMEVKQMCGRAGRPGYDPYGEAILVAKNEKDAEHLMDDYIHHDSEKIKSKLFQENVLRSHILGLFATGDASSEEGVADFLRDTFFGRTSNLFGIESVVEEAVDFLVTEKMIRRRSDEIEILPFGKRVSDLYIDPITASLLRDAVLRIDDSTDPMQILIAAAMTPDVIGMFPKKADQGRLNALAAEWGDRLLVPCESIDQYSEEYFFSDLKVAALMQDWIEEVSEDAITDSMGIGPGDIRSKVDRMDWIIYAMGEIAYIFNPDAITRIRPLSTRIRYGVKEELMDLVSLRGVGRSRARVLFKAGYVTRSDIAAVPESVLAAMPHIGPALARSIKLQVGPAESPMDIGAPERMSPSEEEAMMDEMAAAYGEAPAAEVSEKKRSEETGPRQASLFDF